MTLLLALIALATLGFLLWGVHTGYEHDRYFVQQPRVPRDWQRRAYRDAVPGFPVTEDAE